MTDQTKPLDSSSPEPVLTVPPKRETNLFIGPDGLRAGWRLLLYLGMVFFSSLVFTYLIRSFLQIPRGVVVPSVLLVQETMAFIGVFGAAWVMSLLEHRPVSVYGLPGSEFLGKRFWLGFLLGLFEVGLLIGLIAAFGGYSFGPLAIHGAQILRWGAFHLILFIMVGLFEEFCFRGYIQYTLGEAIGFWPAALLLSVGFGLVHLRNQGEGIVGAASVAIVGLFLAFTLRRTGSLWFAVGLHASFDWGETFLFSVPNSGLTMPGQLSHSILHGPTWLAGGSVGPEGSVFCFLTMGLQFLVVALLFPASPKPISFRENSELVH